MHEEIDPRKLRRDNLKRWSVLEDTIFCVTENTRINQIRLSIDSLENEDKDTVYRLLLHTAELRPGAYALLAQIWDFIEENPSFELPNPPTPFLQFIQDRKEIKQIIPHKSLQFFIMKDNLREFKKNTQGKDDWMNSKINYHNEVFTVFEFVAYCGAVNIFKYCIELNIPMTAKVINNAIRSGNEELQYIIKMKDIVYKSSLLTAVKYHRNSLAKWIRSHRDVEISYSDCITNWNTGLFHTFFHADPNIQEAYDLSKKMGNNPLCRYLNDKLNPKETKVNDQGEEEEAVVNNEEEQKEEEEEE